MLTNDILFDIDWQGTKQLSKFKNLNLIKIYLITDNRRAQKRLIKRNQNIRKKLKKDLNHLIKILNWKDYDYIIINKNLEVCFKQIENIINTTKSNLLTSFQITQ